MLNCHVFDEFVRSGEFLGAEIREEAVYQDWGFGSDLRDLDFFILEADFGLSELPACLKNVKNSKIFQIILLQNSTNLRDSSKIRPSRQSKEHSRRIIIGSKTSEISYSYCYQLLLIVLN